VGLVHTTLTHFKRDDSRLLAGNLSCAA
jgi:hypothetical protein